MARVLQGLKMLRNMTKIEKSDGKNLLQAKSRASIQAPSFPSASQGTVKSHERLEFIQLCLCQIELSGKISRVAALSRRENPWIEAQMS